MKWKKTAAALLAAVMLAACGVNNSTGAPASAEPSVKPIQITNQVDLKIEQDPADMTQYKWMTAKDTSFTLISFQESIRMFEEGGSGILVYSTASCPFCNRALPVLDDVLAEYGIRAYLIDTAEPIAETQAESMAYFYTLCGYISSIFEPDANGQTMFLIPEVIGVKDGNVVGHHLSLVDSYQIVDAESQMTEAQIEELKQYYREVIEACAD